MNTKQRHIIPKRTRDSLPRPLVKLSLAFIGGVIYARYFPISMPVILVLFLLLLMAWFAWGKEKRFYSNNTPTILLIIFAALLGTVRMETQHNTWQTAADEIVQAARLGPQIISGTITEMHRNAEGGGYVVINHVSAEKWLRSTVLPGKIQVRAPQKVLNTFQLGNQITCEAQIIPIRGPSIPSTFNIQEFNASKRIFGKVYLSASNPVQVQSDSSFQTSIFIRGLAYECMKRIRAELKQFPNADENTALIASICFGIRSNMPVSLKNQLQESGLAHITSISGLHVSMILLLLFKGLKTAGLKRKHSAWFTLAVSVCYLCLVGFRVPAIRSVLMAFVFLGKYILQRRADPLNSLGLAALIILLLNPGELFLASFQLSFMATLTLLLLSPYDEWLQRKVYSKPLLWLIRGIVGSIIVVLALAPFTVYYFHMMSWGSILGNLIAVPIVTLLLPITYVWSLLLLIPLQIIHDVFGYVTASLCETLLHVTGIFSNPIFWSVVTGWNIYRASLLVLSLLLIVQPRIRWVSSPIKIHSYQLAMLLWIGYICSSWIASSHQPLRMDFLSLGQGDCIFIQTPDGKTMLIDGGSPAYKKDQHRFSRLEDYLLSEGIHRIDVMVLTHPQADHIGDLANIANQFDTGLFLEGAQDHTSTAYNKLNAVLQTNNTPTKRVKKGDSFQLGKHTACWILSPSAITDTFTGDINEQSVVILMESMGKRFLFTGDIGTKTENNLCQLFENWKIDILKVPHHGSRYSSGTNFLQETLPKTAVIQVGRNTYGHPHDDTRFRLYDINAHILRNDYDGTVRLQTFGNGYRIYTTQSKRLFIYDETS